MKWSRGMRLPALLLALLGMLAWLQFRWTGQISIAERERMQDSLQSSLRRFTGEIDEELALLVRTFRLDAADELGPALANRWERYREEARYPTLVDALYVADSHGDLTKLDDTGALVTVEWPPLLERARDQWERPRGRGERPSRGTLPFPLSFVSEAPILVVPIASRVSRRPGFTLDGHTVIIVDVPTIREAILPELAERYFGADFEVAVIDGRGELVFATPGGNAALDEPDALGQLFSLERWRGRPPRPGERRRPPLRPVEDHQQGTGLWKVFVRHRAGSLEAAVASARARNLAVSFGILGLLAASIGLVALSTRRAVELNDRKMEFVAGVSHELRTPLAVLRSAGQNLADGSVSDPAQVKRYGLLIESEGRRLNDLVEQVLELAGIQSQKRRYRHEPILAESLVSDVLRDCEAHRQERDVPISTSFPTKGITLMGDREALRRALSNILGNALKHGDGDNAIEILAEPRGSKIAIVVSDRGPGISEEERAHLFEAFYRGRRAQERQVPGSGLGLSLVDHVAREHGGRVEVESTPGKGSRFTLYLPAAAPLDSSGQPVKGSTDPFPR
ncbi:MAG TPA: HAMP domain-containing sensor histidine kinase [Vicinamibacteria bacterium]|nr:HAMP domain-containing sensor histidine kinase [Vicinamibacteria bacterium]